MRLERGLAARIAVVVVLGALAVLLPRLGRLRQAATGPDRANQFAVETGFDAIPLHRRAEAFRSNDGGWAEQTTRIDRYVTESQRKTPLCLLQVHG